MTYDSATDATVDALRAIAVSEVVAGCLAVFGAEHPAIKTTFGYPIPIELLAQSNLPALAVYVASEATRRHSSLHIDTDLVVTFEYVMPQTPIGLLDKRWPALRKVWGEVRDAVCAGTLSGTDVLTPTGVIRVEENEADVTYGFAAPSGGGGNAYPHWIATIPITVRASSFDPSDYEPFTELAFCLDLYRGLTLTYDDLVCGLAEPEA